MPGKCTPIATVIQQKDTEMQETKCRLLHSSCFHLQISKLSEAELISIWAMYARTLRDLLHSGAVSQSGSEQQRIMQRIHTLQREAMLLSIRYSTFLAFLKRIRHFSRHTLIIVGPWRKGWIELVAKPLIWARFFPYMTLKTVNNAHPPPPPQREAILLSIQLPPPLSPPLPNSQPYASTLSNSKPC